MTALVLETFVLMLLSVAIGVAIGFALRELAAARVRPAGMVGTLAPIDGPVPEADEAPAPTVEDLVVDPDRAAAADQVGLRPPALAGPRDGRADDLKRIRGIGPQTEARLQAIGIHHLDQIAAWSADEARWVGAYLALAGRIDRDDWVGQARALADAPTD